MRSFIEQGRGRVRLWRGLKALLDPQTQTNQPGVPDLARLSTLYEEAVRASDHHDQAWANATTARWEEALRLAAEEIVPQGAYVAELGELGLRGEPHTGHDYARRLLKDKLGYENVQFERFDSNDRSDEVARIEYHENSRSVNIRLASFIQSWLPIQHSVFHEAAHPAAGHVSLKMLKEIEFNGASEKAGLISERRLARQPPIITGASAEVLHAIHEAEADLRAEYGVLHSQLEDLALEAETPGQFFR